ncbi:MAG: isocitrate lyase/PEP mutase family protein [Candidatus Sedimenticola endophacoides]
MPCCFDAFSARLIEQAGFPLTFMSGFAVSAARLGVPDTGLITATEMLDQGRGICSAVSIPVIGDADTGYGNPMNVRRTVRSYAEAGFACAMIEDQEAPKRLRPYPGQTGGGAPRGPQPDPRRGGPARGRERHPDHSAHRCPPRPRPGRGAMVLPRLRRPGG